MPQKSHHVRGMVSLGDGRDRIESQTREQQAKRQRVQVSPLGMAGGFSCPGQLQEVRRRVFVGDRGWQVQGSGAVVAAAGRSAWRVVRPLGGTGVLDSSTVLPP